MHNMIGPYGEWTNKQLGKGPAKLSFLNPAFKAVKPWKKQARLQFQDCISPFTATDKVKVKVTKTLSYDGLHIELLEWQLPYGPKTEAVFLKPLHAKGKLPGILGLHDHGGKKFYGLKKITDIGEKAEDVLRTHKEKDYDALSWANEIAKRGYGVLVHDTFLFGSRRVKVSKVSVPVQAGASTKEPSNSEEICAYNKWASGHESTVAKSIFCSGNTWPAYYLYEDQIALSILSRRKDIDAENLGCGGLSGGGLRTVMLAGVDDRIKACFCAGFMSTWRDFMLNKCHTHTWMTYIPTLPQFLDFPEILGMRVPLPTMVLNCNQDGLYTLPEMKRADAMLKAIYKKAGASEKYSSHFADGGHQLTAPMQKLAFDWFDRWLKNTKA